MVGRGGIGIEHPLIWRRMMYSLCANYLCQTLLMKMAYWYYLLRKILAVSPYLAQYELKYYGLEIHRLE